MNWNFRLVKRTFENGYEQFGIHEAYYDESHKVFAITEEPMNITGESIEDANELYCMMQEAFNAPVLNWEDIPEDGADNSLLSDCDVDDTVLLEDFVQELDKPE